LVRRLAPHRRKLAIREFHKLYYTSGGRTWKNTRWLGARTYKTPLDMWIYQELVVSLRPELIIETGTFDGGSALFLATVCDAIGSGEIVTIDVAPEGRPEHERITYLTGSSTSREVLDIVDERTRGKRPVMVVLDSDHSRDHVREELRSYADYVTPGSYLVVEDTNLNGNPVRPAFGPGPMEAVREFLDARSDFQPDPEREKFLLTFNPGGYLQRAPLP
jgi:cephalosporin hydroxylase